MSQPACRHCGTVLAHYARAAERAAEKVAVVNALLADANHNGIPDMFEGAARMGVMPTGLPQGAGQPVVVVHSAVIINGQVQSMSGAPAGRGPPPGGYAPSLYGNPAAPSARRGGAGVATLVAIVALVFIAGLAGVLGFLLLAR
ncbi:MAG TPA: hypothetical protein VFS00_13585 [Polyangiaceae bacterium]|nr:hypothetical protein [Polyangiaceae bacterium]